MISADFIKNALRTTASLTADASVSESALHAATSASLTAAAGMQEYERASHILKFNCAEYITSIAISLGALQGLCERLQNEFKKKYADALPQTQAFIVVDLWGRCTGIESMLRDVGMEISSNNISHAKQITARMGAVVLMLDGVLAVVSQSFAHIGTVSEVSLVLDVIARTLHSTAISQARAAVASHISTMDA